MIMKVIIVVKSAYLITLQTAMFLVAPPTLETTNKSGMADMDI